MPKIIYIEFSGKEHVVDAAAGQSVMEAAVKNNVPGIDAECGGACSCATCHVFVDASWFEITREAGETERAMLDFLDATTPHSRLACQIKIDAALDGLVVRMPESQN